MIKRKENLFAEKIQGLCGGKGEVQNIHFLSKEESLGHGRLFAKCIIPPGASIGYHQHNGDFETYYILEGSAKMNDNGNEVILNPGDVQICEEGTFHGIENIGDTDLVYIATILFKQ